MIGQPTFLYETGWKIPSEKTKLIDDRVLFPKSNSGLFFGMIVDQSLNRPSGLTVKRCHIIAHKLTVYMLESFNVYNCFTD